MPGAEDLKRDSKMDAALGWCCCFEDIDGERDPVPWNSVFYRKIHREMQERIDLLQHSCQEQKHQIKRER